MLVSADFCELRASRANQVAKSLAGLEHVYQHPTAGKSSGCVTISSRWQDVRAVIQAALEKARAPVGGATSPEGSRANKPEGLTLSHTYGRKAVATLRPCEGRFKPQPSLNVTAISFWPRWVVSRKPLEPRTTGEPGLRTLGHLLALCKRPPKFSERLCILGRGGCGLRRAQGSRCAGSASDSARSGFLKPQGPPEA